MQLPDPMVERDSSEYYVIEEENAAVEPAPLPISLDTTGVTGVFDVQVRLSFCVHCNCIVLGDHRITGVQSLLGHCRRVSQESSD